MINLSTTVPGRTANKGHIVIGGHYDTKVFSDIKFLGANDGGSSAAWLLEMARATKDLKLQSTLEFVFYDGEEAVIEWSDADSLYGSRHDVDRRVADGSLRQLKALILVDMIGDKNLGVDKETQSDEHLQSVIAQAARQLGYSKYFFQYEMGITDDHVSFINVGVPAVDVVDAQFGRMGPQYDGMGEFHHANTDTMDKVSQQSLEIVGRTILLTIELIEKT